MDIDRAIVRSVSKQLCVFNIYINYVKHCHTLVAAIIRCIAKFCENFCRYFFWVYFFLLIIKVHDNLRSVIYSLLNSKWPKLTALLHLAFAESSSYKSFCVIYRVFGVLLSLIKGYLSNNCHVVFFESDNRGQNSYRTPFIGLQYFYSSISPDTDT